MKHAPDGRKTYYVYGIGLLYEVDESDTTKTYHFDQVGSGVPPFFEPTPMRVWVGIGPRCPSERRPEAEAEMGSATRTPPG